MKIPYVFFDDKAILDLRRDNVLYDENSGDAPEALRAVCDKIAADGRSRSLQKADMMAYIFDHAQLEIACPDIFADRINGVGIIQSIRDQEWKAIYKKTAGELIESTACGNLYGAYSGDDDFGHTCPDWRSLLNLGLPGVLARAEKALEEHPDSDFYRSCIVAYKALIRLAIRFASAAEKCSDTDIAAKIRADAFRAIAERAPKTLHEAMQLTFLVFRMQKTIEGEDVRSLGRLDVLYSTFCTEDDDETRELLRYCFNRYYDKTTPANIPFTIGGEDVADNADVIHLASLMLDVMGELNNPSPKVQFRIGKSTPSALIYKAFSLIRSGSSSFVFCNDETVTKALIKNGHDPSDAVDYVMIGCYESSVMGRENACTCNGRVSLMKAVECALGGGRDLRTGYLLCPNTKDASEFEDFEEFFDEVCRQAAYFAEQSMSRTVAFERCYMDVNPSPILSGSMADCIESGRDVSLP